jgi:hypothetical protein
VREKRAPVVIVELREEATPRLVRRETQQAQSVGPWLAAEEQPELATRRRVTFRRAVLALPALQSDRLAPAFFARGRQL